ncbi:MAG: hypothetical protein O9322_09325 [Beijerinckiaceae bacterium]|nr:hypothetical protein [Beijerinckiaceae bacterium]MCZ8299534.1 hypothetical protein [Beijerinckiaceae bacterium]
MNLRLILQRAAIGAGALILAIGLAVAQTAPAPAPSPAPNAPAQTGAGPGADGARGDWRAAREACRNQVGSDLRGQDRREAMRTCMAEKRGAGAGPQLSETERNRIREMRGADRTAQKEARKTCREGLKNQRLTEDERRTGIEDCVAKANPRYARALACRREADSKNLEKRSGPYREFMRSCIRGA